MNYRSISFFGCVFFNPMERYAKQDKKVSKKEEKEDDSLQVEKWLQLYKERKKILDVEQMEILEYLKSGQSFFMTGSAGTGKTFLLSALIFWALGKRKNISITATTGAAVDNLRNLIEKDIDLKTPIPVYTLHSWSGLGVRKTYTQISTIYQYVNVKTKRRCRETEILIVDEISMATPLDWHQLDGLMKRIRGNNEPFGGIQVVCSGDFSQLGPVLTADVPSELKNQNYVFENLEWQSLIKDNVLMLSKVYRQKDELSQILGRMRYGKTNSKDVEQLRKLLQTPEMVRNSQCTILAPTNYLVDTENKLHLSSLTGTLQKFKHNVIAEGISEARKNEMIDDLSTRENWNDLDVEFKIGSLVVLTKNININIGLNNGRIGTIVSWDKTGVHPCPIIRFNNNIQKRISYEVRYYPEDETMNIDLNNFKGLQFFWLPLKAAKAITINRAQGREYDSIAVHIGKEIFAPGQAYVAISRAKSLEGLSFIHFEYNDRIFAADLKVIDFYSKYDNNLRKMLGKPPVVRKPLQKRVEEKIVIKTNPYLDDFKVTEQKLVSVKNDAKPKKRKIFLEEDVLDLTSPTTSILDDELEALLSTTDSDDYNPDDWLQL